MNDIYRRKVELLLRVLPSVIREDCFAIHGGTAINLFHENLRRLSVDIDLTYIPLKSRDESLKHISEALLRIGEHAKRAVPGINVVPRLDISKLTCAYRGVQIKIEVNQTKRGVIGEVEYIPLCESAQEAFRAYIEAPIVPTSQLYGGKVAAALSRQHPRDLFDIRFMSHDINGIKPGIFYALLGSDRPILESLAPNFIDQRDTMETQFKGMSDMEFSYTDFEATRQDLVLMVNAVLTNTDKQFLVTFENGEPDWTISDYGYLKDFPSVKWKLLNIQKLQHLNSRKHREEVEKLIEHFRLH